VLGVGDLLQYIQVAQTPSTVVSNSCIEASVSKASRLPLQYEIIMISEVYVYYKRKKHFIANLDNKC